MPSLRVRAAWVLPIVHPPIRDGAVLVGDDGRIVAVGPSSTVPHPPGVPALHFDRAVLLPGLINAHTHLELTGLAGPADDRAFPDWIRGLRARKQERSPADYLAAAREGLRACWAGGVTSIADTGDSGAVIEALAEAGGSGVVYHEVFGPHPSQCGESMAGLVSRLRNLAAHAGGRIRLGVSPHALYSVSGPLYRAVAALAEGEDLPVAVHLAESPAETELVARSAGAFAEAWRARGIPLPDDLAQLADPLPVRTPVRWLDAHGVLGPGTLCIHTVQVDADDISVLARRDSAIAHCPRSNALHGHGAAPLRALLNAGLRVGLGTDSEASVGPLDLFAEAREARRLAELSPEETLRLMTLDGALAIGLGDVGVLDVGAWGDLTVVAPGPGASPEDQVLGAGPGAVLLTGLAGAVRYRRNP